MDDGLYPKRDGIAGVWQPEHPLALLVRRFGAVRLEAGTGRLGPVPFWRIHWYDAAVHIGTDARTPIGAEQAIVIPPWWQGQRELADPAKHRYLHVEVPELRRHHLSTSIPPLTCFPKGEHSDSHSVATALHAEGSVGLALQCRLHGLAGQLIGRALESIGFTDRDDNRHHYPPELHRALSYIHQDFAEPITVADLSQAACCSPSRLNRAFRQHLSSSVSRYLVDYRLERAAEMLCGTSHSVDQIASRCGFSQRAYFSRSFKAYLGQAPASYRAEA